MASFLVPHIELDVHSSIIDCNWYYGCLFSPRKKSVVDVSDDEAHVNNRHHPIAKNLNNQDASAEEGLRKESNSRTDLCFGSSNFHSAEKCKEYVDDDECLASMFGVLDKDCDGRVSVDDIISFSKKLNLEMPKEEVEVAVRSVSACGADFLDAMEFEEFYRIIFIEKEEEVDNVNVEEKAICEAFGVFDQNGDGFISAMELADVLCRLGFVEGKDVNCCESMIESLDFNGDGFVDIHEFKHMITRNNTSPSYPSLQCVTAVN